jgi:dnd system-associated protein 4
MKDVSRDAKHEDLVKLLAEKQHPNLTGSLFRTMRELLCFSAVLGYHYGKKVPLGKKTIEIPSRVFENSDFATDIIYLLALCEKRTGEILKPDREGDVIKIFEEYANGGLEKIGEWLRETPEDAYGDQALINAIQNNGFLSPGNEEVSGPIEIEI